MIIRRIPGRQNWFLRSPFDELEQMRRQLDRLIQTPARHFVREPSAGVYPLMNITEDKDAFYVRAELPGIKADDLDISVTGKGLSISGERKIEPEDEKATYHRKERDEGNFSRIIHLPSQIDTSKAKASARDGILTIMLPKAEEAKPRQISIKTA